MPIKKIEMICLPCKKCEGIEARIRDLIKAIEMANRIKIPFEFVHTKSLKDIGNYSLNAAQTPALLINGVVEFAGRIDVLLLRRRLEAIHKS